MHGAAARRREPRARAPPARTRSDAFFDGTEDALRIRAKRVLELEGLYMRQFPGAGGPHHGFV
ncbi:MAG: DUF6158 family protein [Mycobacteriales bacterium]